MSFQTNSGRSDCGSLNGLVFVESEPNAVSSIGAVSPIARATPRIAAVTRPARAVGTTTFMTTRHCGAPSASEASRSGSGIVRRISSEVRVTVGSMRTASAIDAGDAREAAPGDPDREHEETGDDARQPAHRVGDEPDRLREPTLDLVQVHRRQDRERYDDDRGDADLLERADDRVLRAAARRQRPDLAQVLREESRPSAWEGPRPRGR